MLRDLFSKRLSRPKQRDFSSGLYQLNNLDFSYGRKFALEGVDLEINSGEIVFVTGSSGAGKTTLLKIIAGELEPTSGKVRTGLGRTVFSSQVFQDLRLIDELSGEENIKMVYDPLIYSRHSEFKDDLEELASVFGIKNSIRNRVCDMNGGMKQKIAIIRALMARPDVFIADEPTSSLDLENARRLFDVLNLYNVKRNLTVIWATHNRELVKRFSGRIIHLDNGKIVHSGHACFI